MSADELVKTYGIDSVASLPVNQQQRYKDYATDANVAVSAFLYKWADQIPLKADTAELTYSKRMAFKYAKRLKQVDDGSANVVSFDDLYKEDKDAIASVLKAKPARVNTRRLVSNGYNSTFPPYSQVYGQRGLFKNPHGSA